MGVKRALVLCAAVCTVAAGCSAAGSTAAGPAVTSVSAAPTPTISATTLAREHKRDRAAAAGSATAGPGPTASRTGFHASTHRVTAADLGKSWHPGCPVSPSSLRALSLTFWGFDGRPHHGTLIAYAGSVPAYTRVFRTLFRHRFPIRRMEPVSSYGGSDDRSMAADNTSAFNCRYAVANGPKRWSVHSFGQAVDINPRENPYQLNGEVLPPEGKPYVDRGDVRPGMIVAGSLPVRAFAAVGWQWGGRWSSSPDYQHFSATGG